MARPIKENLAYFSHDTDARNDRKMKLFISETGLTGIGFYWSILEDIYNHSYYLPWTKEDQQLFVAEFNTPRFSIGFDDITFCIQSACKWGLIDKSLYEKHSIFTSPSTQRRYLKALTRRKLAEFRVEYLLINMEQFYKNELEKSNVSVKIVDKDGDTVRIYGEYVENLPNNDINGDKNSDKEVENVDNSKKYDEKYDFDCSYSWDGQQPIDYAGCVERWNVITGGQARITDSKRTDLRRVFRNYTGRECLNAMIVRAKNETIQESKYKTDWSTLFGAKKLENLDKWVGRGREWMSDQKKMTSPEDYLDNGWVSQAKYKKICDKAGIDFEDPTFCETKKVDNTLLYYPQFSY